MYGKLQILLFKNSSLNFPHCCLYDMLGSLQSSACILW